MITGPWECRAFFFFLPSLAATREIVAGQARPSSGTCSPLFPPRPCGEGGGNLPALVWSGFSSFSFFPVWRKEYRRRHSAEGTRSLAPQSPLRFCEILGQVLEFSFSFVLRLVQGDDETLLVEDLHCRFFFSFFFSLWR